MNWFNTLWLAKTENAAGEPIRRDLAGFLLRERELSPPDAPRPDPFMLKDMDKACARLAKAVERGEKILIHGDYDVDGLSSTALLADFLRSLGTDADTFIPHRLDDGYGLNESGIDYAVKIGAALLVTVDCGIRSAAEVDILQKAGIDCVICDHHEPGDVLPAAVAVVDAKRKDDTFPFKELSGAGTAYQLCRALARQIGAEGFLTDKLEALATLGTIADVMSLEGENRRLVAAGLEAIERGVLPGVTAMLRENGGSAEPLTAKTLAFTVCPRLNAAGRMGDAGPALRILESRDPAEIARLLVQLNELNACRRAREAEATETIEKLIAEDPALLSAPILLLKGEDFHPGIVGIVAARVKEKYHKPAIVFTAACDDRTPDGKPLLKGSGRTEGSFDLLACLSQAADILNTYGGHVMACGVSVAADRWDDMYDRLVLAAAEQRFLQAGAEQPENVDYVSYYDCRVSADCLTIAEYEAMAGLEPFGKGNEEPLCLFDGLEISGVRLLGKERKHLRLAVAGPEGTVYAIAFGMGDYAPFLAPGEKVTLLGQISLNVWQGRKSIQIMVKDILLPGEEREAVPALKEAGDEAEKRCPCLTPEDIVAYWKGLGKILTGPFTVLSLKRVPYLLRDGKNCAYTLKQVESMHEIFTEAGLVEELAALNRSTRILRAAEPVKRVRLSDTAAWQRLLKEGGLKA